MTHKPSPRHIEKELDRLEKTGEVFLVVEVAHKLNTTPQRLAAAIRMRGNAVYLARNSVTTGIPSYSRCRLEKRGILDDKYGKY